MWSGATLVPLDYKLTAKEQLALLAHCQPKVLITEYPVWRKLSALELEQIPNTTILVTAVTSIVVFGICSSSNADSFRHTGYSVIRTFGWQ